jgi:protein O-GlcNAc transferase
MLSQLIHAARLLARDYAAHTAVRHATTSPDRRDDSGLLDNVDATTADATTVEAAAWSYLKSGDARRAANLCEAASAKHAADESLFKVWIASLRQLDEPATALDLATTAAAKQRDPLFLLQERLLLLPLAFHDAPERQQHYARFLHGLAEFDAITATLTAASARRVLDQLSPNFELAYLGCDVTAALQHYGRTLQRLAAIAWPQWAAPLPRNPVATPRRLRIGYVSAHLHIHSASLLAYGWMTSHSREQFEVHIYHVGDKHDVLTGKLAHECEHFVQIGSSLESACAQILADQLDILVYVDIGMEMLTSLMASLRLAPLQCATWAHPISTGLPTIDVFISNTAMEPASGQAHYNEHLLQLPGTGACLQAPWLTPLTCTRRDFAVDDSAVVYLSLQPITKYLAEHDGVFANIASQVPNARFLFMEADTAELTQVLQQRLQRAFAAEGLNAAHHLRWLPRMDYDRYLQLLQLADVFLDPPGAWSAGITATEAIACALPLVTWPGEFLRSRQACGMLSVLGITDTIACDSADYIAIATRLGNDRDFRNAVRGQLQQRQSQLFGDTRCMQALEAFYRNQFFQR